MMGEFDPEVRASRVVLAEAADFDLGRLRIRPIHRKAIFGDQARELEPRVMQVLVALAAHRPEVVSRDRLVELCWDGRIVGDDAINRCILALRHLDRDFAPGCFAIETVPRVGYCLIEATPQATEAPRLLHFASRAAGAFARWTRGRGGALAAALVALMAAGAVGLAGSWGDGRREAVPASIAVLPFRSLSAGDPYFAEGIGEEVLARLAREPQFKVAGRSSASELRGAPNAQDVGRRLAVSYVLEGSVRTQGDRIRVNAALIKTQDGMQLWSNSYDGKLDDVFAIQASIGDAIAVALSRKLIGAPPPARMLPANGEAYSLYLTARGLLRLRQPRNGATAGNLLRDAINIDPAYAPAWAGLATATQQEAAFQGHDRLVAAIPQAQAYARQALRLAPDLDEAHRALAQVSPYGSAEGQAHFRRAAELDPGNAENLLGLGSAQGAAGEFAEEQASYRRAAALDPLWFRTTGAAAISTAEMGDRAGAEYIARRGFVRNPSNLHILLGRIAWLSGDFSEAIDHWAIAAQAGSPRWSAVARRGIEGAAYTIGMGPRPQPAGPGPFAERYFERVWAEAAISSADWQAHNRNPVSAEVYRAENVVAAKLMLNAGRSDELVANFDQPVGLLGLHPGHAPRLDQLSEVAVAAEALKRVGRSAAADRLLAQADASVRAVYRRNRVPFWFDAAAAEVWAVQGRTDDALSALERAARRGWAHAGRTDLPDLAAEPAFAALRETPRFVRIQAAIGVLYARERREAAPFLPLAKPRDLS